MLYGLFQGQVACKLASTSLPSEAPTLAPTHPQFDLHEHAAVAFDPRVKSQDSHAGGRTHGCGVHQRGSATDKHLCPLWCHCSSIARVPPPDLPLLTGGFLLPPCPTTQARWWTGTGTARTSTSTPPRAGRPLTRPSSTPRTRRSRTEGRRRRRAGPWVLRHATALCQLPATASLPNLSIYSLTPCSL